MKHHIAKSKEALQKQVDKLFNIWDKIKETCEDLDKLLFGIEFLQPI